MPALVMDRLLKVATPLSAFTVVVPPKLAPLALVSSVRVMLAASLVGLPNLSWTATWTAGESGVPAMPLDGWAVKASFAAGPAVMSKAELLALASPEAL